jgi:RNA polymerase sigma factor (sigma-70 family)
MSRAPLLPVRSLTARTRVARTRAPRTPITTRTRRARLDRDRALRQGAARVVAVTRVRDAAHIVVVVVDGGILLHRHGVVADPEHRVRAAPRGDDGERHGNREGGHSGKAKGSHGRPAYPKAPPRPSSPGPEKVVVDHGQDRLSSLLAVMGTSAPPPPAFRIIVETYTRRIACAVRWAGVPEADVADVAQEVFLRLHNAMRAGRVDTSRPLLGWLLKTARSIARDRLARAQNRYESLATPDSIDQTADTPDRENRMNEAVDVHAIIERILPKLRTEDREVFVMADLEDTPMDEVMAELNLKKSTAYARLTAGRRAFAREWKAMQESRDPALVPFLPLAMEDIVAAAQVPPELPPGFMEDIFGRLAERLGPDFDGPPTSAPGGAPAAGAAARVATAGAVTLAIWKLALLCLLMGLMGAGVGVGILAAQRAPEGPAQGPAPASTLAALAPGPATSTAAPTGASSAPTSGLAPLETRPEGSASAASAHDSQEALLDTARQLLRAHDPAKALAVLARINAPHLTASREALRRRALAEQAEQAAHP